MAFALWRRNVAAPSGNIRKQKQKNFPPSGNIRKLEQKKLPSLRDDDALPPVIPEGGKNSIYPSTLTPWKGPRARESWARR